MKYLKMTTMKVKILVKISTYEEIYVSDDVWKRRNRARDIRVKKIKIKQQIFF